MSVRRGARRASRSGCRPPRHVATFPAVHSTIRATFATPGFFIADATVSVILDGGVVYRGSFRAGFDLVLPVSPGDHKFALAIDLGIATRHRAYVVRAPAGQTVELAIAYSRLWGNFKKTCAITVR